MSNNSKKLASSNERFSFSKNNYLARRQEEGRTPENDPDVAAMNDYYNNAAAEKKTREQDEEWRTCNLEYDLRSTAWICEKVQQDEAYAQNLYAAMCNNDFQKLEVMPILKEQRWHCSWRYAGGIVADMREQGDYIDWYCSGIQTDYEEINNGRKYVAESVVTDEIREDLKLLDWAVVEDCEVDC